MYIIIIITVRAEGYIILCSLHQVAHSGQVRQAACARRVDARGVNNSCDISGGVLFDLMVGEERDHEEVSIFFGRSGK